MKRKRMSDARKRFLARKVKHFIGACSEILGRKVEMTEWFALTLTRRQVLDAFAKMGYKAYDTHLAEFVREKLLRPKKKSNVYEPTTRFVVIAGVRQMEAAIATLRTTGGEPEAA